jgi:hypothetical protein
MKTHWLLAVNAAAIFALTATATFAQDRSQRDDQNRNGHIAGWKC